MSVLFHQKPLLKQPLPSKPGGGKSGSLDLAQLKLKQGATVYQATIKTVTRGSLNSNSEARVQPGNQSLQFKRFSRSETGGLPRKTLPAPPSAPQNLPLGNRAEPTRANLDAGYRHLLRGNGPAVLGEFAGNASGGAGKKQITGSNTLTERFSAELEDALGEGFRNGVSAGVTAVRRRRERDQRSWSTSRQESAPSDPQPVPSFVPDHGISIYQASGCNCVASFMGFADSH